MTGQLAEINFGSYWERGNQNEIVLVAVNDLTKTITLTDIKLNRSKLSSVINSL